LHTLFFFFFFFVVGLRVVLREDQWLRCHPKVTWCELCMLFHDDPQHTKSEDGIHAVLSEVKHQDAEERRARLKQRVATMRPVASAQRTQSGRSLGSRQSRTARRLLDFGKAAATPPTVTTTCSKRATTPTRRHSVVVCTTRTTPVRAVGSPSLGKARVKMQTTRRHERMERRRAKEKGAGARESGDVSCELELDLGASASSSSSTDGVVAADSRNDGPVPQEATSDSDGGDTDLVWEEIARLAREMNAERQLRRAPPMPSWWEPGGVPLKFPPNHRALVAARKRRHNTGVWLRARRLAKCNQL